MNIFTKIKNLIVNDNTEVTNLNSQIAGDNSTQIINSVTQIGGDGSTQICVTGTVNNHNKQMFKIPASYGNNTKTCPFSKEELLKVFTMVNEYSRQAHYHVTEDAMIEYVIKNW